MSLPQANATLTAIAPTGSSADYDHPGGEDAARWEGREDAYLSERTERVQNADRSAVIVARILIVSADADFTVEQGDTVHLEVDGEPISGEVRAVARRKIPGIPGTYRIALEDL